MRSNKGTVLYFEFFYKSIFSGKINFENSLILNTSISGSDEGDSKIRNQGIENSTKIILKLNSKINTFITSDYYRQNLKSPSDNLILDYHFSYTLPKKKAEFRVIARNLLDNQHFVIFQVSDFSISQYTTNILPRSIMLYFSYQF